MSWDCPPRPSGSRAIPFDNEYTLKILAQEKGLFVLRPANKAYAVIRPGAGLEIFGVVTGLFRKAGVGRMGRKS